MDNQIEPSEAHEEPKVITKPPKKERPIALIVVALAVVLALGVLPRLGQAQRLKEAGDYAKETVPSVSVTTLTPTSGEGDLALPSNLQAIDQTSINARSAGYVSERFVDIGSVVKKGDLLAIVQSPDLDEQYGQSQAQTAQAQAAYQGSQADSAKLQAGTVGAAADVMRSKSAKAQSVADLAHAQSKFTEAQSSIRVYQAKVTEAEKRLSEAEAGRSRSQASFALAKKTLVRWKELEKANAVSGQDVDEKQAAFDTSQASVEASEAAVSTAQAELTGALEAVVGARADARAAEADVNSAKERVVAAAAAIDSSKANERAAQEAYRASRSSIASASAAVTSSQANAGRLRYMQSFERIVAPFDGVITARNVDVGDLVNPNSGGGATDQSNAVTKSGLFGLARQDAMRAIVSVPEDNAIGIHVGQAATVTIQELPGKVFWGTVFHVSGALDSSTRTLSVEVRVPNLAGKLVPGMYAQVIFHGVADRTHLWLPSNALISDGSGTRVATVTADGILHYVPVTLGRDLGTKIEVLSGLAGGEKVDLNPDSSMAEGTKVQEVQAQK